MILYHGTDKQWLKNIKRKGLKKGGYVTSLKFIAEGHTDYEDYKDPIILKLSIPKKLLSYYIDINELEEEEIAEIIKNIPIKFIVY